MPWHIRELLTWLCKKYGRILTSSDAENK